MRPTGCMCNMLVSPLHFFSHCILAKSHPVCRSHLCEPQESRLETWAHLLCFVCRQAVVQTPSPLQLVRDDSICHLQTLAAAVLHASSVKKHALVELSFAAEPAAGEAATTDQVNSVERISDVHVWNTHDSSSHTDLAHQYGSMLSGKRRSKAIRVNESSKMMMCSMQGSQQDTCA